MSPGRVRYFVPLAAEAPVIEKENYSRIVWALAWPAVALNSLQVLNTLLDRFFIGHLHTPALTAHGASTNVMFLVFSLAASLGTGASAIVSRAFGASDPEEYQRGAQESLGLAIVIGFVVSAITALVAGWTAHALLPARDIVAQKEMTSFVVIYAAGLLPIFVIQTLAGSLRGVGDTKSPMVISGIQIAIHMLLNVLLVPRIGLSGAATALSVSAWLSAIGYVLYARHTALGHLNVFRVPHWDWGKRILRIAVPAATMSTLRTLSLTAFTLVLKQVPNASDAIAAMSTSFAVESIMFMPAFGLSMAAGALVGQSLGMEKPERAERIGWVAAHYGALVTIVLVTPVYLLAPWIAGGLVDHKPAITQEATRLLRYLCVSEFLFAYAMVFIGAMQGAGDIKRPLWISVFALWGLRVPLAVVLSLPSGFALAGMLTLPVAFGMGANGAWLAMAFTQGVQGILSAIAFKQGRWKYAKV
ncbi:MATE family efflux transporter [bacterium]|nr:MAG: MATE family efflux transporter [bacterium]